MVVTAQQARAVNRNTLSRLSGAGARLGSGFTSLFELWSKTHVVDMGRRFGGRPGLIPRSGTLRASIGFKMTGHGALSGLRSDIFSKDSGHATLTGQGYARLQEFGGTIKPKHVSFLTIPTLQNVGANGLPKYRSAAQLRGQGRTLLVMSRRGNPIIMVKEGGVFRTMWVLRRSVYIPPRLLFYGSFALRRPERLPQMTRVIRAAFGGKA